MSERWRALVVGCGRIGGLLNTSEADREVLTHALAYRRHAGFELAACADPNTQARAEFMRRWHVPRGYATLDEALASEAFDIVSIAGPTSTHLATLERLATAPVRAVLAEKPLGGDTLRARAATTALAARGIPVAVNFQRRWDSEMVVLREQIAAGEWGILRAVTGRYVRGIVNNGGHWVNLLAFLIGQCPEAIWAGNARYDGVEGDPTCDARMQMPCGSPVSLTGSDGRDYAIFEMTLCFSTGEIRIERFGFRVRSMKARSDPALAGTVVLEDGEATPTAYGQAMLRALDDIRAWRPGMRLASDADSGLETLEVNESLRTMALRSSMSEVRA